MIPYIETNNSVTFFLDCVHKMDKTHPLYNELIEKLERGDDEGYENYTNTLMTNVKKALANHPDFSIKNGILHYKDEPQTDYLAKKIVEFHIKGKPIDPQLKFFENVMQNPSFRARTEAYKFVEDNDLPITPDGTFLAYKRVNLNYTDVFSGRIYNDPGSVVEMDRNLVDDDPSKLCSYGFHICGFNYLAHFSGARIVTVEVNPRDVVAVPLDYNGQKMRVCKYKVHNEIPIETAENIWAETPLVSLNQNDDDVDDVDDVDDDDDIV